MALQDIFLSPISIQDLEVLIRKCMGSELNRHLPAKTSNEPPDLIDIKQAASLLGYEVSSIYGMVHRRGIPHMKKGKKLFFSREELLEWVKEGRMQTSNESEQKANDYLIKK